jgi:hypothetical protein
LFNDEQYALQNTLGQLEEVKVVMMPPKMQSFYMYDWEWPHNDNSNGEVIQHWYYDDGEQKLGNQLWEIEHLEGLTPTTNAAGHNYNQPWEAWHASTPNEPAPVPFPSNFNRAKFVAWDRKPLEPITLRELQDRDMTWRTRAGQPAYYFRDEELSNRHYLYPHASSATWTDQSGSDADPDDSEYGSTTLDVDNNLLVIFDKNPTELTADGNTPDFPAFLHKYLEYGVVARAYEANTDGRIPSLAEYWEMRRKFGFKAVKIYMSKRRSDRHYQLRDRDSRVTRQQKHPRFPDAFDSLTDFTNQ